MKKIALFHNSINRIVLSATAQNKIKKIMKKYYLFLLVMIN
jgi:hypothetical protein